VPHTARAASQCPRGCGAGGAVSPGAPRRGAREPVVQRAVGGRGDHSRPCIRRFPRRGPRTLPPRARRSRGPARTPAVPAVSMSHPSPSGSATTEDDVCLPWPVTGLTLPNRTVRLRHQRIHQRGLADAGRPDEHADPAGQRGPHPGQRARGAAAASWSASAGRAAGNRIAHLTGRGQIRLGQNQQGSRPASYAATRQRSTKRRLGDGEASEQTITIWSALATMIALAGRCRRRTAAARWSAAPPDDTGQRPLGAGRVARQRHPVADHTEPLAELARLHRHDQP